METHNIVLYILFHIACGLLVFGWEYSFFTKEYPILTDKEGKRKSAFHFSLVMSLFGPLSIPAAIIVCGRKHGCLFRPRATRKDFVNSLGEELTVFYFEKNGITIT